MPHKRGPSIVVKSRRRLKATRLFLGFLVMTPDQISEWFTSEQHYAELEALMPSESAAPGDRPRWLKKRGNGGGS